MGVLERLQYVSFSVLLFFHALSLQKVAHKRMVTCAAWGPEDLLFTCAFDRSGLCWRLQQHSKDKDKEKDKEKEREKEKERDRRDRAPKHNA